MEKTLLIAGKDLPEGFDFADAASGTGRNVMATSATKTAGKASAQASISSVVWTRTSPISARSVVLQCESAFRKVDEAVLYFDEAFFASRFTENDLESCSRTIDQLITGYQYMTLEILNRFKNRFTVNPTFEEVQLPGKLVFLYKSSYNETDLVKNANLRNTVSSSNPFVAAAAAAFQSFAENISAVYGGREYVSIILAKADVSNEIGKKDSALSSWLCGYMDEIDKLKNKLTAKQSISWVKAGAKATGFFMFK